MGLVGGGMGDESWGYYANHKNNGREGGGVGEIL